MAAYGVCLSNRTIVSADLWTIGYMLTGESSPIEDEAQQAKKGIASLKSSIVDIKKADQDLSKRVRRIGGVAQAMFSLSSLVDAITSIVFVEKEIVLDKDVSSDKNFLRSKISRTPAFTCAIQKPGEIFQQSIAALQLMRQTIRGDLMRGGEVDSSTLEMVGEATDSFWQGAEGVARKGGDVIGFVMGGTRFTTSLQDEGRRREAFRKPENMEEETYQKWKSLYWDQIPLWIQNISEIQSRIESNGGSIGIQGDSPLPDTESKSN